MDALVSNREYTQALALIDSGLAGSMAAPDYLLLALAEKQPKTSARYLVRLRDKKVRAMLRHSSRSIADVKCA